MKTLKKLQQARQKIKDSPVKKLGKNTYSNYDYFTPEQISEMVSKVNKELNLFHKYDLVREQYGLMARLEIFDLDSEDSVKFQMATEIPEIKATNVAQQLGGCVTYSERYLLQVAYDIKDNNLDFDTDKPAKKQESKPAANQLPWLNPKDDGNDNPKWVAAIKYLYEGGTIDGIKMKYKIGKANEDKLTKEAKNYTP